MEKYTKEDCVSLLCAKAQALTQKGETRFPKRSDFSDQEVMAIKAFLGPWPRALEAAGLKEAREGDRIERNRAKRIAAKRLRREAEKLNSEKNGEKV